MKPLWDMLFLKMVMQYDTNNKHGEKPYQCRNCDREFWTNYNIKIVYTVFIVMYHHCKLLFKYMIWY